jgi:hypothetical protein
MWSPYFPKSTQAPCMLIFLVCYIGNTSVACRHEKDSIKMPYGGCFTKRLTTLRYVRLWGDWNRMRNWRLENPSLFIFFCVTGTAKYEKCHMASLRGSCSSFLPKTYGIKVHGGAGKAAAGELDVSEEDAVHICWRVYHARRN